MTVNRINREQHQKQHFYHVKLLIPVWKLQLHRKI